MARGGGKTFATPTVPVRRGRSANQNQVAEEVEEPQDTFVPPPTPGARPPSPDEDTPPIESGEGNKVQEERQEQRGSEYEGSGGEENVKEKGAAGGGQKKPAKKSGGKKAAAKSVLDQPGAAGVTMSVRDMVHNTLLYFLMMQHKKLPVKRSEIIKHCMNDQNKAFTEVIRQLGIILDHIFGLPLTPLETSSKTGTVTSYIIVSRFNLSVSDTVTDRNSDIEYRRTILFLILAITFMLNRSIDEDSIWRLIAELGFHEETDPITESVEEENQINVNTQINYVTKREDLSRFLKREYLNTLYLQCDNEQSVTRYSWGLRAEKEYSKYAILKAVTKYFPGKKPQDFVDQYNFVREKEREAVDADALQEEQLAADFNEEREELAQVLGLDISAIPLETIGRSLLEKTTDDDEESEHAEEEQEEVEVEVEEEEEKEEEEQVEEDDEEEETPTTSTAKGKAKDGSSAAKGKQRTSPRRKQPAGKKRRRIIVQSDDDDEEEEEEEEEEANEQE